MTSYAAVMPPPRVAFFGSPEFAVPTLEALIASPYRPVIVVTQPDRPAGRGRMLRPPPVRAVAEAAGIPVLQPARLREPAKTAALASYEPALQVIAAYGQILPPEVLALPRWGTLNVHASLLPRWRGAAPVAAAIRAGDEETGVTIMLVDEGEDTGPILTRRSEPIRPDDNAGSLGTRLARLGAALLLETIPRWLAGEVAARRQDEAQATRATRLRKEEGAIDWSRSAAEIARLVRAFSPWPGATTTLRGQPLRVWQAAAEGSEGGAPGVVVAANETIDVGTGAGLLRIARLQRAGKQVLAAHDFLNGESGLVGQRLGEIG